MGLFSTLRGKGSKTVTAHILDPNRGYVTETWSVGKEVSADVVARHAEGQNIYVVFSHEGAKVSRIICKMVEWLDAKAQYDGMDQELADSKARIKAMLDKIK